MLEVSGLGILKQRRKTGVGVCKRKLVSNRPCGFFAVAASVAAECRQAAGRRPQAAGRKQGRAAGRGSRAAGDGRRRMIRAAAEQ